MQAAPAGDGPEIALKIDARVGARAGAIAG